MTATRQIIRPQEGFQMKFLSSPADIVIGGGAAGVGKSFAELIDPIRYINIEGFGGTIFRRLSTQISNEGGLWDASNRIYGLIKGAEPIESRYRWRFANGNKITFNHLQYEKNIYDWQGAEIPYIAFDELTHFSEKMFFYLLSRSRSMCGVKPYVRATCNPDPDSWVADLIAWWIDQETGFPIPERDGVIRYYFRQEDSFVWGDSVAEVYNQISDFIDPVLRSSNGTVTIDQLIKSITFISGSIYDNKKLLEANPEYLANLLNQDAETKARLFDGNWKVRISEDEIFDYYAFRDAMDENGTGWKGGQDRDRYITADIALEGSDKFVVYVWEGWKVLDIHVIEKSDGKEVVDIIRKIQMAAKVPNRNVAYDNDGVGGFVGGFIKGAIPFMNGSKALQGENYKNLKSQCAFRVAKRINDNEIHFTQDAVNAMYSDKQTIKQRLMEERRVFKKHKPDHLKPMEITPKQEMKLHLSGTSPDLMDAFIMREVFEMKSKYRPRMYGG